MLSEIILYTVLGSAVVAWLYGIVLLVLTYQNRRFWRSHHRQSAPILRDYPRVTLIISCKGMGHRLRENLTAYIHQDHPNFELQFVVESEDDSAVNLIRNVMRENRHVPSRLVVSGRATNCGQKVHNLLRAMDQLDSDTEVLAFGDSDACPQSSWLKWLVQGIENKNVGAKTGGRWMIPIDKNIATLLGCTINNSFAALSGRGTQFLIWGGSWAIHREIFKSVGIREAWNGVLSDELVAGRALFHSGLSVQFEPQSVCTSRVKFTGTSLTGCLWRQFVVARRYVSTYWFASCFVTLLAQLGYWGGLVLGLVAVSQGNWLGLWLLASSTLMYVMGIARAFIRQNMGRMVTSEWRKYRTVRKFDIALGPLIGLYTAIVIGGSAVGSRISWDGIRYHISRGGRILLLGRKMKTSPWPIDSSQTADIRLEQKDEPDIVQVGNKRAA